MLSLKKNEAKEIIVYTLIIYKIDSYTHDKYNEILDQKII